MKYIASCAVALALALAGPTNAQSNNWPCGALVPDTDLVGAYTLSVGETNASFMGLGRTQQGHSTGQLSIFQTGAELAVSGWPQPGAVVALEPVGPNQGPWSWGTGVGGLPSSNDIEIMTDCPITQLPRYQAYAVTQDRGTGMAVEHRLSLVMVLPGTLGGYWTFSAGGAGIIGTMSVSLRQ